MVTESLIENLVIQRAHTRYLHSFKAFEMRNPLLCILSFLLFYQGSDKREGAGAGNWGTTEDDLKAQTEPTEEKPAVEGAAAEEEKAPPAPVEPEEKTLTLEEYYAQRKKSNRNPNARQAEEKVRYFWIEIFCYKFNFQEAATNVQVERTKKGRAARVKEVDFKPAPIASRRGDNRGGRGRGGGRGGNRGSGDRPRNNEAKVNSLINSTPSSFNFQYLVANISISENHC